MMRKSAELASRRGEFRFGGDGSLKLRSSCRAGDEKHVGLAEVSRIGPDRARGWDLLGVWRPRPGSFRALMEPASRLFPRRNSAPGPRLAGQLGPTSEMRSTRHSRYVLYLCRFVH
jgi:hypothetical protein